MGQIMKTRKHLRSCPCPRKPPVSKTGGPLHLKPWTISDFPHRRRQFLLREPKSAPPQCDEYFGSKCTDITETQRHLVPLHALHPNLLNAPDPFHNRKVTSVTEYITHAGKPRIGPVITSEAMPYHGTKATSITSYLRYVPPAHPAALGGDNVVLPFHGIRCTDATSAPKNEELQRAEPTILTYMLPHRPKTAPTVVFPQHVSPAVLVNAIAERRRMFLEKPMPPGSAPNSARGGGSSDMNLVFDHQAAAATPHCGCNTARSDTGVSYGAGDTSNRPKTCSNSAAAARSAAPLTARTEITPRSDRAAPPTSRQKTGITASEGLATTLRTDPAGGDQASKMKTGSDGKLTPRPTTVACATSRSQGGVRSGKLSSSSNCSEGTPASVSTTPGRSQLSSSRKPCAAELLSTAAERLGPEKLQRITSWKGHFAETGFLPRTSKRNLVWARNVAMYHMILFPSSRIQSSE